MKNKGIVFTMDITMAIIVVFLILVTAQFQMNGVKLDYWDFLYAQSLGNGVISVIDEAGTLATLDGPEINSSITGLLPPGYGMRAEIESYSYNESYPYNGGFNLNETILVRDEPTADGHSAVSGIRVFVSGEGRIERYNIITYKIWLR